MEERTSVSASRNYRIDNLRCIAIIIVVLGHSIIIYDPSWGILQTEVECEPLRILKQLINVIQMPLFFVMSGYLYLYSANKYSFREILEKKFQRLIIPFVIVLFLFSDPIKSLLDIPGYQDVSGLLKSHLFLGRLGHLWFLPTLLGSFILSYYPLKQKYAKYEFLSLAFFLILHLISRVVPNIFLLDSIAYYTIYVYAGALMSRHESMIYGTLGERNSYIIGGLIVCLFSIYFFVPESVRIICVLGIIVLLYLILPNRTTTIVSEIGKCSFGIYLLHSPLIYLTYSFLPNCPPPLILLINFGILGTVVLLITQYIQKTKAKFVLGF